MQERMDNEAEDRRENLIALVARTDFYPSLTFELASKAAKVLDRIYPEWMEDKDNQDLLIKKVVELNPRLAADEQWPTEEHKSTPESRAAMNALLQEHGYYPNHPTADNCTNQTAPTEAQLQKVKELEFKMAKGSGITADKLAVILELQGQAARAEDLSVFRTHGITHFVGDALASYALRVVIGYFQELAQAEDWRNWDDMRILRSCQIAGNDPAFQEPSLTLDGFSRVTFSWPKRKLQEWFRKGAQF